MLHTHSVVRSFGFWIMDFLFSGVSFVAVVIVFGFNIFLHHSFFRVCVLRSNIHFDRLKEED